MPPKGQIRYNMLTAGLDTVRPEIRNKAPHFNEDSEAASEMYNFLEQNTQRLYEAASIAGATKAATTAREGVQDALVEYIIDAAGTPITETDAITIAQKTLGAILSEYQRQVDTAELSPEQTSAPIAEQVAEAGISELQSMLERNRYRTQSPEINLNRAHEIISNFAIEMNFAKSEANVGEKSEFESTTDRAKEELTKTFAEQHGNGLKLSATEIAEEAETIINTMQQKFSDLRGLDIPALNQTLELEAHGPSELSNSQISANEKHIRNATQRGLDVINVELFEAMENPSPALTQQLATNIREYSSHVIYNDEKQSAAFTSPIIHTLQEIATSLSPEQAAELNPTVTASTITQAVDSYLNKQPTHSISHTDVVEKAMAATQQEATQEK